MNAPIKRRQFLGGTLGAVAAMAMPDTLRAQMVPVFPPEHAEITGEIANDPSSGVPKSCPNSPRVLDRPWTLHLAAFEDQGTNESIIAQLVVSGDGFVDWMVPGDGGYIAWFDVCRPDERFTFAELIHRLNAISRQEKALRDERKRQQ